MTEVTQFPGIEEVPERKSGLGLGSMILLGLLLVISAIVGIALVRQNQLQPTEGRAPDFTATTFDGQEFKLSDMRGKVVVLNFWASWCIPCKDEAPELEAAWQAYKDKDVVFIGIAYADNGPRSLAFMEEYNISYMNAPDLGTRISEMYNIQGVPETFIIDQEGNVVEFIYAGVTQQRLASVIDQVLMEG